MIDPIGNGLTVISIFILIAALLRIRGLTRELGASAPVLLRWRILTAYIMFFIIGYIVYATMFWDHHQLIISAIFFFGALFVWVVSILAHQTVLNLRRVALLEHQNVTDALTGLYNRRYLDQRIHSEYEKARRYQHPLSVLMLDIDLFKKLNDRHGHQAGDLALHFLSGLMLDGIRERDIAARYGGEEFVIIAPNTQSHDASELAERLRMRIESHELKLARAGEGHQTLHITVSIGVAELTPDIVSGEQLIECADKALYQAKQSGRNRTSLYRPDLPSPFAAPVSASSDA